MATLDHSLTHCLNNKSFWKYYVLMYENGKMRPVETIPGMGGRGR
jgi:hypothetical protein